MPQNVLITRMLQARADHEAQQRQDDLIKMRARPKPSPDTLMRVEDAELLVQVHDYEDGEQIGRTLVGHTSDAYQVLRHFNGQVVADAHHDRVLNPIDPFVLTGTHTGWTVHAGRLVRKDEVA